MTSVCVITKDGELLVRLIDWLDQQQNNPKLPTTIHVREEDMGAEIERLRADLAEVKFLHENQCNNALTFMRERDEARALTAKRCVWRYDDTHNKWDTSCGEAWMFSNEGSVAENGVRFCLFCGGLVHEAARAAGGGE